jgi:hypothetical protein
MSRNLILLIIVIVIGACSSSREASKKPVLVSKASQDSTEYQIIIDDLGFDQWYLINFNEAKDHSDEYYRTFNLMTVPRWNDYFRNGQHERIIGCNIEYWPNVEYGIEVNRKLFWYFKYIETTCGIPLLR